MGCFVHACAPEEGNPASSYNRRMFVHLRLHSEFSVVDGTTRIDEAVASAAKDGQGALAIADLNNLFGALKFYKAARGKGVKPVIGAEICLEDAAGGEPARLLLLVQNRQGYLNLCELLTRVWTQSAARGGGVPLAMAARSDRGAECAVGRAGGPRRARADGGQRGGGG